jgi:hypothetical protein
MVSVYCHASISRDILLVNQVDLGIVQVVAVVELLLETVKGQLQLPPKFIVLALGRRLVGDRYGRHCEQSR